MVKMALIKKRELLIFFLVFIIYLLKQSAALDLYVDTKIIPEGTISKEYLVVGDSFHFNITFFNFDGENINTTLNLQMVGSNEETIIEKIIPLNIANNIPDNYFPYKENKSDWDVWRLDSSKGVYKLILTTNENITFYVCSGELNPIGCIGDHVTYPKKFVYLFDAMPKWQHELFMLEQGSLKKQINASEDYINATNNLVELNKNISSSISEFVTSSKRVENATWLLLLVGIITLYITIINIIVHEETRRALFHSLKIFLYAATLTTLIILFLFIVIFIIFLIISS